MKFKGLIGMGTIGANMGAIGANCCLLGSMGLEGATVQGAPINPMKIWRVEP